MYWQGFSMFFVVHINYVLIILLILYWQFWSSDHWMSVMTVSPCLVFRIKSSISTSSVRLSLLTSLHSHTLWKIICVKFLHTFYNLHCGKNIDLLSEPQLNHNLTQPIITLVWLDVKMTLETTPPTQNFLDVHILEPEFSEP